MGRKSCWGVFFLIICSQFQIAFCNDSLLMEREQYLKNKFSKILQIPEDSILNIQLIDFLDCWLGTPYKYAGDSINGIDCSGFTNRLYNDIYNIDLESSSLSIYNDVVCLKKSQLKEGDLIFFKIRKSYVSHVGIYLGNNKFAHATVSAGIIVSDLSEPYYQKHYFASGRCIVELFSD